MRLFVIAAALAAHVLSAGTYDKPGPPTPRNRVDELLFAQWKALGVVPANLCSDSVFVRRAYLDVIGTLPTAAEAAAFLADPSPAKRSALIDTLLGRPEFADYWAMKWSDRLRVKAEFPINLWPNAAQAYSHWILDSIRQNKPYDRFVREMLTASGSNFRSAPVNFYRAMQNREPRGIAQTVAQTFMGEAADKWPAARLDGMAAFFAKIGDKKTLEWKEEILFFDPDKVTDLPAAVFPDGTPARIAAGQDPREVFAAWLITPENPWFTRAAADQVWTWLMGQELTEENPELLKWLAGELAASHYDLKQLYRLILNSTSYQLAPAAKSEHFTAYPLRRLDAEVLIDALDAITGTSETYSSSIPEPYTYMPDFQRAISLPDGSISSPFLELFGRPPRDTGMESERNNRITDAQRLHMLNSSHIQRKLQQSPTLQALREIRDPRQLTDRIYLTVLSRYPTDEERKLAQGHQPPIDVIWALINTTEFQFRH